MSSASDSAGVPDEHKKNRQVFTYLRELNNVRTPVQRDIRSAAWHMEIGQLPEHESCRLRVDLAALVDRNGALDRESKEVLRIGRPELSTAPTLPGRFADWAVGDWRDPFQSMAHHDRLSVENPDTGEQVWAHFADDPERQELWLDYVRTREAWRDEEIPARKAALVFDRIFGLHSRLDREAEKFELILGDGSLKWDVDSQSLRFPVLHQPMELTFRPKVPEFCLSFSERPSTFHSILFRGLNIQARVAGELRAAVEESGVSPLDKDEAEELYRTLVGRLHPHGHFGPGTPADSEAPAIERRPVLFLRDRSQGFGAFIEKLLDAGRDGGLEPSRPMLPVLGVHAATSTGQTPTSGGSDAGALRVGEVLLSKPANDEQIDVALDLERSHGVVVQGPPGTGKSHTIANLIGHLLACGKSVLVTSHTSKALRVLRDKIVPPLQPLAVSVTTDDAASRAELELSIRRIAERLGSDSPEDLDAKAEKQRRGRKDLLKEIESTRQRLLDLREGEFRSITVGGVEFTPSDAARWVRAGEGLHDWIPEGVEPGAVLPLPAEEVDELYWTNGELNVADEALIAAGLPDLTALPGPTEFSEIVRGAQAQPGTTWTGCWTCEASGDLVPLLKKLGADLRVLSKELDALWPWEQQALAMFLRGSVEEALYVEFVNEGRELVHQIRSKDVSIRRHGPAWDGLMEEAHADAARAIASHLASGKRLGLFRANQPGWRRVRRLGQVAGRPARTSDEFRAIADLFEIEKTRRELLGRWQRLVDGLDADLQAHETQPEQLIDRRIHRLEELMTWPDTRIRRLEGRLADAGFEAPGVAPIAGKGEPDELERVRRRFAHILQPAVEEFVEHCRRAGSRRRLSEFRALLIDQPPGSIGADLHSAVADEDTGAYERSHSNAQRVGVLVPLYQRRHHLLAMLKAVAGPWADRITRRVGAHGVPTPPGDAAEAWLWRQLQAELEARNTEDMQALQDHLGELKENLRRVTARLVENLAWAEQIRRTSGRARQDLLGYQGLLKKIGKGTGTRAPKLRREAQKKLKSCKDAVPVWIMPLARIVESFDPVETRFDVVIIDEASQMDVMGLLAFHLADRVLIVGDDEQVSPAAVGQKLDTVDQLIDEHLGGVPNRTLYDGQTSIYDIAGMSFGTSRMLKEHFRCVPEIIAYSNRLAYHGKIQPLRDGSSTSLRPPAVAYRVPGGYADQNNVNSIEAEHTAALVAAAVEQPEYAEASVGVISLLGSHHDLKVDDLLRHHLDADAYMRHRVLCGTPPQFQGDERDVVFLNLVKGPAQGELLTKQAPDNKIWKQRYNVAASRARDQLWVVHSMDCRRDLQPDDIRYGLLEYARDPTALIASEALTMERTESPFENEVAGALLARGYRVVPQYPVGSRRIDLVVEFEDQKVAVECDGDRYHTRENLQDDLERQAVLERLGWRFIRIRGTRFFRDPGTVMTEVFDRLDRMGIQPNGQNQQEGEEATPRSELRERVIRRAQELLREWRGEEDEQPDLERSM